MGATRLYAILARNGERAVIFRRGPSKQVALIAWDLRRDRLELGQWFKGRIYERRCDLSPSGEHLLYFAASWRREPGSWTALSKPPYLTALALWPKGDAWGGGGLFTSERELALNHAANQRTLAPGFSLPPNWKVTALGEHAGAGEDGPIAALRDVRDGWQVTQSAKLEWRGRSAPMKYQGEREQVQRKLCAADPSWALYRSLEGIGESDGPWYPLRHHVVHLPSQRTLDLGRSDWADWHGADLVFARDGRLHRVKALPLRSHGLDATLELADLRDLRFQATAAPPEATRW